MQVAIPLPQLPAPLMRIVGMPAPAANPPTDRDVAASVKLYHEVYSAFRESRQKQGDGQ